MYLSAKSYPEYIRSRQWKQRAAAMIARANFRCQRCGSPRALNVHHLTYAHLGDEWAEDLIVLCNSCHKKEHGIEE